MRDVFNTEGYYARVKSGELIAVTLAPDRHPAAPPSGEPHCTRSQMVEYWTRDRQMVALVHQYLRPDGSLGASGLPDPKAIVHQGVRYKLCKKDGI